jgi:hypothetical protein
MPQDSVDTDSVIDNELSVSSSPGTESVDAGTSHGEASPEATTQPDGTSSESPANADTVTEDGTPGQQAAETQETSAVQTLEKRFKDTQAWATKTNQEKVELQRQFQELQQQFQEMRQQYAGVKPDEISEWRSTKALPPWDERSPEHPAFLKAVDKAETFDELMEGETDQAEIQKMQQRMVRALGDSGVKMLNDWRADVRRQERERRRNPQAYIDKRIDERIQQRVPETLQQANQRYQEGMRGRTDAEKWMANKEVATPENVQKMLQLMDKSRMPFEVASAIVERDHYRSQVSNAQKAKQSAEEKERLLQGNAAGAISRNPSSGKKLDVAQHLKEKGISGRAKIDELFNLDREGLL